jgi:hypothetical protein
MRGPKWPFGTWWDVTAVERAVIVVDRAVPAFDRDDPAIDMAADDRVICVTDRTVPALDRVVPCRWQSCCPENEAILKILTLSWHLGRDHW